MRPLFTIHAGEYLVGTTIEKFSDKYQVWVPATDTGIDLLVTNHPKGSFAGLQVKFSKDFYTKEMSFFEEKLESFGWWTINARKIRESEADFWIFVLYNFNNRKSNYIVIPPEILLQTLERIYGKKENFSLYLILTKNKKCWDIRGLKKVDQKLVINGFFKDKNREFTKFLNAWKVLRKKLKS